MILVTPRSETAHLMAMLLDSVPPDVKNISPVEAPIRLATVFLAFSMAARVVLPSWWIEEGFPKWPVS